MFEFITLFLSNFTAVSLGLVPSTIDASAIGTSSLGTKLILDDDETLLGTAITSTGTSVLDACDSAYETTLENLETTQAYIESLNEEELNEMIAKLELKDIELSIQESKEENNNAFQKTKKL